MSFFFEKEISLLTPAPKSLDIIYITSLALDLSEWSRSQPLTPTLGQNVETEAVSIKTPASEYKL